MNSNKSNQINKVFKLKNNSRLCLCPPSIGEDKQQRIINLIKKLQQRKGHKEEQYILVTKKPSFRLIASTHNIKSQDFNDIGEFDNDKGWREIEISDEKMQQLKYISGQILQSDIFNNSPINNYVVPTYQNKSINNVVYRTVDNNSGVVIDRKPHLCGIIPKNLQQMMAADLLLNDDIPLTALFAVAGTGKTLLTIASGMQKVLVQKKYRKLVITRPVIPIGRDIGFLPGDLQDKMEEWLLPFWNNIEYIASINKNNGKNKFSIQKLKILLDKQLRKEYIQILPISYMRGCSLSNSYVIIDQAQNTTPSEMKTIITRIGENSKLVLTGDVQQIDNPYLSKQTNGLTMAINKFKNEKLFGYVQLNQSERSQLSKLANKILF